MVIAEIINTNARNIMRFLDVNGKTEIHELLLKVNLNDTDFNMAIGWLIREGKISFFYLGNKTMVDPLH